MVIAALGLLVAAGGVAQVGQEQPRPFSAGEAQRLRAGELVIRQSTRREGPFHYVGGTSWQRVRAPIDQVWETVLDVGNYDRLIPSLEHARVVEERDGGRLVRMEHRYSMASASYFAHVYVDQERRSMRFDLDRSRPHDLRAGRGFLSLSEYRGDTIVTWGALADMGGGMVQDVFGPMVQDWMLVVPRCVRDAIELPGGGC